MYRTKIRGDTIPHLSINLITPNFYAASRGGFLQINASNSFSCPCIQVEVGCCHCSRPEGRHFIRKPTHNAYLLLDRINILGDSQVLRHGVEIACLNNLPSRPNLKIFIAILWIKLNISPFMTLLKGVSQFSEWNAHR